MKTRQRGIFPFRNKLIIQLGYDFASLVSFLVETSYCLGSYPAILPMRETVVLTFSLHSTISVPFLPAKESTT